MVLLRNFQYSNFKIIKFNILFLFLKINLFNIYVNLFKIKNYKFDTIFKKIFY